MRAPGVEVSGFGGCAGGPPTTCPLPSVTERPATVRRQPVAHTHPLSPQRPPKVHIVVPNKHKRLPMSSGAALGCVDRFMAVLCGSLTGLLLALHWVGVFFSRRKYTENSVGIFLGVFVPVPDYYLLQCQHYELKGNMHQ